MDKVIFRKWEDGVIALFPALSDDHEGRFCESFQHVGQHGGADYHGIVARSRPATPAEYRELARELRKRGYKLDIRRRATRADYAARLEAAKRVRQ